MRDLIPLADVLFDAEVFTDGDWVETKDQDPNGDVRLTQLADVGDGRWINKSTRFLTSEKARQLKCTYLRSGDLLVARMPDPLGRCCVFPGDSMRCVTVVDVCVIRPNQHRVDNRYLMHVINAPYGRRGISRHIAGTTRRRISRKNLGKVEIPLPPLAEQRRIARILDTADALRAKRHEALAQLDTLLQSIFLDMFGDPVTNPMGWEEPRLEDLCKKVIDCPHSTPRWTESGVVCLRTSNLGKGEWKWTDTRFVSEEDYTERTRRGQILPNDIILSREGTVGVLALVDDGMRLCMGQRLVQLRVNDSQLAPRFLLNLLLHSLAPEQLGRLMAGSTSKHLNVKELRKLPVLLPPLEIQRRFSAIAESVERQKARQRAHLAELDTLFASLQARAFRGDF